MAGVLRSVSLAGLRGIAFGSCCCLLACGAADQVTAARSEPPDNVGVDSTINTCPSFAFSLVLPQVIRASEVAVVAVRATDADSDDAELGYAWSATSGDFAEPSGALTEYTCVDFGPQVLSVIASDSAGCQRLLDLDVNCLERLEQ